MDNRVGHLEKEIIGLGVEDMRSLKEYEEKWKKVMVFWVRIRAQIRVGKEHGFDFMLGCGFNWESKTLIRKKLSVTTSNSHLQGHGEASIEGR
ncbi:uncharacterized protein G2W53_003487 [Senna tora]|uniref:Uncharacterized protein n=1 Tax=Senna tora TaxID=362788 RepID=A0A834XBL8_9FABA|nr:uncharacterized protein G2W53_003487 [Senna tora]